MEDQLPLCWDSGLLEWSGMFSNTSILDIRKLRPFNRAETCLNQPNGKPRPLGTEATASFVYFWLE
jgi:hypothetical protein